MSKIAKYMAATLVAVMLVGCTKGGESNNNTPIQQETSTNEYSKDIEPRKVPEGYGTVRGLSAQKLVAELEAGWNLGDSLDALGGEKAWGNVTTTKEIIDAVKAKGFNTIRIPTSWGQYTAKAENNYKINPTWLQRVGDVVDYAIENDMYVILNTHHETKWIIPTRDQMGDAEAKYLAIWSQIAAYFSNYGDHLIFEGLNEPRVVDSPTEWNGGTKEVRDIINELLDGFVKTVRSSGGNNANRLLLLTSEAAAVVDAALKDVIVPENDPCIAMSLHAYTPYDFTFSHSGDYAEWTGNHKSDIDWLFGQLDRYFLSKGIPVVITEFGNEQKKLGEGNNDEEAAKWIKEYVTKATEHGVPTVIWDNGKLRPGNEKFGYLDRRTLEWGREVVIDAMLEAAKKH